LNKSEEKYQSPVNQEELLKEEAEDLYQNAPCGYISILPDRTIAKVNNVILEWLGYAREEVVFKKKFTDIITIGGKIYYETHHDPLQRMQGFVKELNYDLVRKDGTHLSCLLNSIIKKDGNGNILLSRTTIFDITERKKYEKELLNAKKIAEKESRAKAQLLSVMSHEIRTPMNAIIGLSHILLEDSPRQDQYENLNILKVSAENLLHLLNSILDFSKVEAGKAVLDEIDFSIRDLVKTVINTLKIKAEEKGIEINLHCDSQIPEVFVSDPVKITQVLTNLIGNAIKFTANGSVTVSLKLVKLKKENATVEFSVSDTGIGIAKEKINNVFNEYEQAETGITREFGGTGLGLAISKKLVEFLGGNIKLESTLGSGSTFSFEIPLKISDKSIIRDSWGAKEIKVNGLKGIHLLLAEDNNVNVLVISKFLRNWELSFDVASNGKEALDKIQDNDYDLVLMDLQMPVMNGYETTERVRALPDKKYQELPIIALTASAIIGQNHKIFFIGMNDYVSKPFNPKDLYNKIEKYGRRSESHSPQVQEIEKINTKTASVLNFEKYELIAEGDKDFLNMLTAETIQNFKSYKAEVKHALLKNDIKAYEKLVHKMKLVVDVLEVKELENKLKEGTDHLNAHNIYSIEKLSLEIDEVFDKIIGELNSHLKKLAIVQTT